MATGRRLNLTKVVKFSQTFLLKIGNMIKLRIREDALNGVFQNNTSGHAYRSKQYVKYKLNGMRRFTKNTKIGFKKAKQVASDIQTRTPIREGAKLKGMGNRSVNTDVSKVNMTLTGDTHKGMKVTKHSENIIEVSWNANDYGKIKGNEMLGRVLVGLNDKNEELVVKEFLKEMTKQFDAEFPDKILL